jgi:hypothetical protein
MMLTKKSKSFSKAIFKNHMNTDNYDHYALIDIFAQYSSYASDSIGFEIKRLQNFAQVNLNYQDF